MKKYTLLISFLLATIVMINQSCEYENFEIVELNEDDTVSFKLAVLPIMVDNCLGSGCHVSSGGVAPNLTEEFAYITLTGGEYLDFETPENSLLYERMIAVSKPMPPAGKLSDIKTKTVLQWIKQGGLDN